MQHHAFGRKLGLGLGKTLKKMVQTEENKSYISILMKEVISCLCADIHWGRGV